MICRVCGIDKAQSDYYTDKQARSGYRSECKECTKAKIKERYDPAKAKIKNRNYRLANLERIREQERRYAEEHKEERRIKQKAYYQRVAKYRRSLIRREWQRKNKASVKASRYRRIAAQKHLPNDFTPDDWKACLDYWHHRCAVCGRQAGFWHTLALDHWIPLSSSNCPGNVPHNIIPLCHGQEGCNNRKHDKQPEEWLIQQYGNKKAAAILKRVRAYLEKVRR